MLRNKDVRKSCSSEPTQQRFIKAQIQGKLVGTLADITTPMVSTEVISGTLELSLGLTARGSGHMAIGQDAVLEVE